MHSELVPRPSPNLLRTSVTLCANVLTMYILRHAFLVCKQQSFQSAPCHCRIATALFERFYLASTSSLPIALQSRQIYFDLLHSPFSPTAISSQLQQTRYEPHATYKSTSPLSFRVAFPIALTKWTILATSIIQLTRPRQEKRR